MLTRLLIPQRGPGSRPRTSGPHRSAGKPAAACAIGALVASLLVVIGGPAADAVPPAPEVPQLSAPAYPFFFTGDLRNLPRVRAHPEREFPEGGLPSSQQARPERSPSGGDREAARPGRPPRSTQDFTTPVRDFPGLGGGNPPDPNGDIGPNHFVEMVNSSFAVYDKQGNILSGPNAISSIFDPTTTCGQRNDGDPVVVYDQAADRWLLSQFAVPGGGPYHMCIAISSTGNPVTGGFAAYDFTVPNFPDYPKFGVWPDAYYMSSYDTGNINLEAFAFDRANMLNGNPATYQRFAIGALPSPRHTRLLPSDWDGTAAPPAGAPNYFVRSADGAVDGGVDRLEIFEFHVDWGVPANSTFTLTTTLATNAFDSNLCGFSRNCVPQPGTTQTIDTLSNRLMFRLQYRNFGDHEALVTNQTVDVDGADHAGIRFYELRKSGAGAWSIYQQGDYTPDGDHRFVGSFAMNSAGEMALGYSVSSGTTFPSLRYAGRVPTDPLGQLPTGEGSIFAGTSSQTTSNRWGDYADMTVDPVDDCTFWFVGERVSFASQIGAFRFPTCIPQISIVDVSQIEGNSGTTPFDFTVSLSRPSAFATTVDFATADGTATVADNDYQPTGGTITFQPGETAKTITVDVNGDNTFELNENFFVNLSNPSNGTFADDQGEGTILNDDPLPAVSIGDDSQFEGNAGTTPLTFTLSLSNPSFQTITVDFATADGTATLADNDYQAAAGTVVFNPGETTKVVTVLANGDVAVEPDESFFVNLTNPMNATIADGQGQGTILNDDLSPNLACTITGTNKGDNLLGTPGDDVICGGNGDDVINGMGGNDVLLGENGKDVILGGDGHDLLLGGNGVDTLMGEDGNDNLQGGNGGDSLTGGAGSDALFGENGSDFLDTQDGVSANDSADGGSGPDSCVKDPGDFIIRCP